MDIPRVIPPLVGTASLEIDGVACSRSLPMALCSFPGATGKGQPETARRLREKFTALRAAGTIGPMSRICFIDDGSKDATWQLISDLHARDPVFSGIRLSRNRGHQNALLCGLMTLRNRADCVISMDADLQDDVNAVDGFIDGFCNGDEVVYGVRLSLIHI